MFNKLIKSDQVIFSSEDQSEEVTDEEKLNAYFYILPRFVILLHSIQIITLYLSLKNLIAYEDNKPQYRSVIEQYFI